MMEGLINYLLNSKGKKKGILDYFSFMIVPMVNVDGVIYGNYRTGLLGCDLNRKWSCPTSTYFP